MRLLEPPGGSNRRLARQNLPRPVTILPQALTVGAEFTRQIKALPLAPSLHHFA